MSREVRRVPVGWVHPKNERGNFSPMFDRSYATELTEWQAEKSKWDEGFIRVYPGGWKLRSESNIRSETFEDWCGEAPNPDYYMPDWPDHERTMLVMYETTSEGTPISPAFATPEELARWMTDNDGDAFAGQTASYEAWLHVARGNWGGPSAVIIDGTFKSGVEFANEVAA